MSIQIVKFTHISVKYLFCLRCSLKKTELSSPGTHSRAPCTGPSCGHRETFRIYKIGKSVPKEKL